MITQFRNGVVYSDAHPFATAIEVDRYVIDFVGDETGADARLYGVDEVIDLQGRLVTPGFADVGDPGPVAWHARQGISFVAERGPSTRWVSGRSAEMDLEDLTGGLQACLDPRELPLDADLGALVARGVPLAFGTAPELRADPWRILQHALARGLSVRAGFNAYTRGGYRADPHRMFGGTLAPGESASLVVWDSCELGVQVADERRSFFTSDARAGVPPLPLLGALDDESWEPPKALVTMFEGDVIYRADLDDTPEA